MRLIDADKLMEDFRNTITEKSDTMDWLNMIYRQPTAYSVDKVVEKLEELRKKDVCDYLYCDVCAYTDKCSGVTDQSNNLKWDKAIEIVKQGGVSDDVCEWKSESDG